VPFIGVETHPVAPGDQRIDPRGRKLHDQPPAHEHGEDLLLPAQRAAAEAAAAARRGHAGTADQFIDEVLETILRHLVLTWPELTRPVLTRTVLTWTVLTWTVLTSHLATFRPPTSHGPG